MKSFLHQEEAPDLSGWLASGIQPCCLRSGLHLTD